MSWTPRGRATEPEGLAAQEEGISFRHLLWRIGVLLLGFVLIVVVHLTHNHLSAQLEDQTLNERARGFIGEEITRRLQGMENDVYQLATTIGVRGQELILRRFKEKISAIRHALLVLERGGRVRRVLQLNLEGHENMIREEVFQPKPEDHEYILEVIDLIPKLAQIEAMVGELVERLERRDRYREALNHHGMFEEEQGIMAYYKRLMPHFVRLNENANRLLYQSHERMQELEGEIALRKHWFDLMQLGLVVFVFLGVGSLGLVFARDIARNHETLRKAWDDMRHAKEEAERASRAKSQFVSRMSHELRTPLNAVLGFAQLLELNPGLRPELKLQVGEINKAGTHLLGLINDVLDLAKIEADRLFYEKMSFDLVESMDEITAILGERAYAKGFDVVVQISPWLPSRVLGDPMRLRQVIINLLGNAVKFTEHGEVGLKVAVSGDVTRVLFEIWDTGPGIPEGLVEKLFQPFTQADDSVSRKFGGSGLGLSISRELVAGMGGELGFESLPGKGARFYFSLPLVADPAATERPCPLADALVLSCSHDLPIVNGLGEIVRAMGGRFFNFEREEELLVLLGSNTLPEWVVLDNPAPTLLQRVTTPPKLRPPCCLVLLKPHQEWAPSLTAGDQVVLVYKPLAYSRLVEAFKAGVRTQMNEPVRVATTNPSFHRHVGKVLLVEDNPVNQIVAAKMLEHLGVSVDVASDGMEALSLLNLNDYSLVLMDVEMPNMNGYEATQHIRMTEQSGRQPIAVVAMTANALGEDKGRCLAMGMNDHLSKPVTIDQLNLTLSRWLPGYMNQRGGLG